jgi:prepilin-type N-terminal cleavage/methylation domain-containing protein
MKRGFSLVELLVALALFGFVVTIASGTLIVLSNSNLTAQLSRKAVDNIDFIMDDIVREARLGKNYHCSAQSSSADYEFEDYRTPANCPNGSNTLALTQIGTNNVVRYSTTTIAGKSVLLKELIGENASGVDQLISKTQISVNEIDISSLRFYISGALPGDEVPAQMLVTLQAGLKKGSRFSTVVNLQTTVVQRELDD